MTRFQALQLVFLSPVGKALDSSRAQASHFAIGTKERITDL